ncbi:hypothetical protein [Streptomyces mirabilis]|uniref:hypothetical protein n=1 Tax=Streptomyces mirabilis TaxID=68239 RepID=UPI003678709F
MKHHHTGARLLVTLAFVTAAVGCGTSGTGASTSSSAEPSASAVPSSSSSAPGGSSVSVSAGSGSASSGHTASPSASPPASTASSGSTGRCLSGTVAVLYPPADNPLRSACVHVGTKIQITLKPTSPNYSWAPVTSSTPKTVTVLDNQLAPAGTRTATARAAAPGTATLSSANTYTPDPHGPPSKPWQLNLTIVP